MKSRISEAVERKESGLNCAQAVATTYGDLTGLDEETICQATSAYGAGMGCMEGTCGCLVGAGLVLGLHCKNRPLAMKKMKTIMSQFQARNHSTICKELKGVGTGKVLRPCNDCVADACEFLEAQLEKQ